MFSMYQILCVVLGEGNCSLFKTHMLNQARNVTTDCRESDCETERVTPKGTSVLEECLESCGMSGEEEEGR